MNKLAKHVIWDCGIFLLMYIAFFVTTPISTAAYYALAVYGTILGLIGVISGIGLMIKPSAFKDVYTRTKKRTWLHKAWVNLSSVTETAVFLSQGWYFIAFVWFMSFILIKEGLRRVNLHYDQKSEQATRVSGNKHKPD